MVHEIYRSLQGESSFAGLPCVFVRLTACQLRAVIATHGMPSRRGITLALDEVVARALALGGWLVGDGRRSPYFQPKSIP